MNIALDCRHISCKFGTLLDLCDILVTCDTMAIHTAVTLTGFSAIKEVV